MTDRDRLSFDLAIAIRSLPRGTLRDLGKRRLPGDDLAERVATEAIVKHLELCGWRFTPKLSPPVSAAR